MLDLTQAKRPSAALHHPVCCWSWVRPCGVGGGFAATPSMAQRPRFQNWRRSRHTTVPAALATQRYNHRVLELGKFLPEGSLEALALLLSYPYGLPYVHVSITVQRSAPTARAGFGPGRKTFWRILRDLECTLRLRACSYAATCMFVTHHESTPA